jgi:hypothetical protein
LREGCVRGCGTGFGRPHTTTGAAPGAGRGPLWLSCPSCWAAACWARRSSRTCWGSDARLTRRSPRNRSSRSSRSRRRSSSRWSGRCSSSSWSWLWVWLTSCSRPLRRPWRPLSLPRRGARRAH